MEFAISLKSGEHISASSLAESSAYRASFKYFLVCPECGEPVHFRKREIPYNTPFFSHYKQIQNIKAIHACSLRILGATFKPASSLISGIKHGQTVDRFQRDFCKELYESFGKYSPVLYAFIEKTGNQHLAKKPYMNLIRSIENFSAFSSISKFKLATNTQEMSDSLSDICLFLESNYGEWVGNFIYQVSKFVAIITHPDIDSSNYGRRIYKIGSKSFIFIAETARLKKPNIFLKREDQITEKLIPQIASSLIAHLILKWKLPDYASNLMMDVRSININNDTVKTEEKLTNPEMDDYSIHWARLGKNKPSEELKLTEKKAHFRSSNVGQVNFNNSEKYDDAINKYYSENLLDRSNQKLDTPKILSWHSPEIINITKNQELNSHYKDLNLSKQINEIKDSEKIYEYEVKIEDKNRIKILMFNSLNLNSSKHLSLPNSDSVKEWARTKNPLEAYFLAAILSMNHNPPEFTDRSLLIKLHAWIAWAKNNRY